MGRHTSNFSVQHVHGFQCILNINIGGMACSETAFLVFRQQKRKDMVKVKWTLKNNNSVVFGPGGSCGQAADFRQGGASAWGCGALEASALGEAGAEFAKAACAPPQERCGIGQKATKRCGVLGWVIRYPWKLSLHLAVLLPRHPPHSNVGTLLLFFFSDLHTPFLGSLWILAAFFKMLFNGIFLLKSTLLCAVGRQFLPGHLCL